MYIQDGSNSDFLKKLEKNTEKHAEVLNSNIKKPNRTNDDLNAIAYVQATFEP